MSKEWTQVHNPFNSLKVLWHKEHLLGCATRNLLPPIQVDTNPTNQCDYNCIWCNSKEMRDRCKDSLSKEHLFRLSMMYKTWGVKSTCIAGGGEPLLNPATYDFILETRNNGIEIGLITNGFHMRNFEILATDLKWCGFSIDAGTPEVYAKLKGVDSSYFDKVFKNVEILANTKGNVRICTKFLIHPENQDTIFDFVKKSKESGAFECQLRPVGTWNLYDGWHNQDLEYNHELINEQLDKAFELETENFHVYGVRHKFGQKFNFKNTFKKCYCAPLLATFCADGYCYLCFDRRGRERMCKHFEIKEFWGSKEHISMLEAINPAECPRCTYSTHNEIIEHLILKDDYTINFP